MLAVMGVSEFSLTASPGENTVLVVDDDVLIRMDVAHRLRDCGFQVIEAGDAAEAIAILSEDASVKLVFSDVQMPGELDGFGLTRWVNAHRPDVPVILASGVVRAHAAADALCHAAAFIEKPYRDGEVAEVARRALTESSRPTA